MTSFVVRDIWQRLEAAGRMLTEVRSMRHLATTLEMLEQHQAVEEAYAAMYAEAFAAIDVLVPVQGRVS